jgi:hypothetical protein
MTLSRNLVLLLFFTAWSIVSLAQVSEPSNLNASFVSSNIKVDGILNDSVWQTAQRISNFTQRELDFGKPVTQKTEVAVAFTKSHVYIAVWCYDTGKITAKELSRDFDYELDDNFIVVIDAYHDKRNGFMFITNPNAARADAQIFNNGNSTNPFWDGVWNVKTTRNATGWFAEFIIPLYTLKYRRGLEDQTWGINFERNIRRKREQARWQGWSRDNTLEQVNQAGQLTGLKNLTNKGFLELKPYVTAGGQQDNGDWSSRGNVGGDVNYLITPNYRLNVTVNTDFAQVEADRQQVNLTRFPLFFPELRQFFLEGDDYFDMGFGGNRIVPFYTRRIGLNDNRETVPILGGVRLLGKERNSTTGFMSIQTGGEDPTNYSALSWRQDIGVQSVLGAMTAHKITEDGWHSTTSFNGRYNTANFLNSKNLTMGGSFIKTHNFDEAYEGRSFAYRVFAGYPNDKISIFASSQLSPAAFNPEIGLQRRENFMEQFFQVQLKPRPKERLSWIRQFDFRPGIFTLTQFEDDRSLQSFEYAVRFLGFDTKSGEQIGLNYAFRGEGLRDSFEIFDGIVLPNQEYWWQEFSASMSTFSGRTLSMELNANWGEFYNGNALRTTAGVLWRASKYLSMQFDYEYNSVELEQGGFNAQLFRTYWTYAVTPNVFGTVLGQWNNATNDAVFNFRLRVIPFIGADMFLIVNQLYHEENGKLNLERNTILTKIIWRLGV